MVHKFIRICTVSSTYKMTKHPQGGHTNQTYALSQKGKSTITIGTLINFGPILGQFGPNLAHCVPGVGSSNLRYALTVVITFRNVLKYYSRTVTMAKLSFTNFVYSCK